MSVMDEQQARASLERLEPFIGTWSIEAVFPDDHPAADASGPSGEVTFEWILDGTFLVERSTAPKPFPSGFCVIGVDTMHGGYTQHYFDDRIVARLYAMTFDGSTWTLSRDERDLTPIEFEQRFTGMLEDGGDTIRGHWDIKHPGADWAKDFDLVYRRKR